MGVGLGWGVGIGIGSEYIKVDPEWVLKDVSGGGPLESVARRLQHSPAAEPSGSSRNASP